MIIQSLLDTDLYKFTMQQTVYHQFPNAREVEYHFKCRTPNAGLTRFISRIEQEIHHLCSLKFQTDELEYLRSLRYMKDDYIDFLEFFQLKEKYVKVEAVNDDEIDITIRGPWLQTILFEVPLLAIVNQVYFEYVCPEDKKAEAFKVGFERLKEKINLIKALDSKDSELFKFSDFGTRRRFSFAWHEEVVKMTCQEIPNQFTGTSNVYFAKKYNLVPIGTMAHEYLQSCQALGPRLRDSQKFALEKWVQEYRGDLGIALTDVVGTDAFLNDFDLYFCKLFDGVRHDSGNPYEWANKFIEHYKKMKINPREKNFVFSDGLDVPKALDLFHTFKNDVKCFFGIGTNLTNDVGYKALNIVIKMTSCNGSSVAKLSDSPGKTMSKDEAYLTYLKQVFHVKE
jgi:nicotinate phosphoribosyltransferase